MSVFVTFKQFNVSRLNIKFNVFILYKEFIVLLYYRITFLRKLYELYIMLTTVPFGQVLKTFS